MREIILYELKKIEKLKIAQFVLFLSLFILKNKLNIQIKILAE